jgi:DNA-binding CsgD family transcriptional regulator
MIRLVGPAHGHDGGNSSDLDGRRPPPPLQEIVSCLDGPFLVINDTFRILNANARAMGVLGAGPDQSDFGRYILGDAPSQSQDMRKRTTAAIGKGERIVLLLRHARHRRLICSVKPIRRPDSDESYGLVTLLPFDEGDSTAARYLRDIYKLSKSEAEIATAAAAGAEVAQIAIDRDVSIHTLRAQIASIKIKMGLTRMTEIAVIVARIEATTTLI